MRRQLASSIGCALLLAVSLIPAHAAEMHTVTDPTGRYTINFPTTWEVMSMNATPLAGQIMSQYKNLFSMVMAIDAGASSASPTVVMVMGMPLETAISPRTFGMVTSESMSERIDGYALVQDGTATIAKRPAFYRYFTMVGKHGESLYSLMVYFTVGKTGYVIFAAAPNQPDTVRKSFGDIAQILETFRPTGK